MQEGRILTATEVNRDLLRSILEPPRWFWPVIGILGLVVLAAAITIGIMINRGLGITNLNRPVVWGFFITNVVFWIGIIHAGIMLCAIFGLASAEWRRTATRGAEGFHTGQASLPVHGCRQRLVDLRSPRGRHGVPPG